LAARRGGGKTPRLRIAGGAWRGRALIGSDTARPTEQRVREALFSRWGAGVEGARVLDLYCGSGAVALEALSRGALEAWAVDVDPAALHAVAANCEDLAADGLVSLRLSIPEELPRLARQAAPGFDFVFADPPYGFRAYGELLPAAAELLRRDGELALEHAARSATPETAGALVRIDRRVYGGSALSRYRLSP
jgi:16S rRNA (guanine966-N2)-methyltransferase